MREKINMFVVGIAIVGMLGLIVFAPTTAHMVSASENSSGGEEYKPKPVPQVDPREVAGEQQMAETIEEGTKPENQTVAGVKSDADGLYLANDVNGVAIKAKEGASLSDTRVTTLDTDGVKSGQAMLSAASVAEDFDLEVGPCVDIYVQQKVDGKLVEGSFENMGNVSFGLPGNFQGASSYSAVVVFPGGSTWVAPATLSADGKSITVDFSEIDAGDASQVMIAICKAK